MARLLALCSLPRSNPGDRLQFKRVNGPVHARDGRRGRKQTALRKPPAFAPGVGLHRSGTDAIARAGTRAFAGRLHAECRCLRRWRRSAAGGSRIRCSGCFIPKWNCFTVTKTASGLSGPRIADSGEFWWDAKHPDQPALWESKSNLARSSFTRSSPTPVPLDLRILKAMKRSPLGLESVLLARLPDV